MTHTHFITKTYLLLIFIFLTLTANASHIAGGENSGTNPLISTPFTINANTFEWIFGDNSTNSGIENPLHVFPELGNTSYVVTLIASNDAGCRDTTQTTIIVEDVIIYYVPNAFTPDGDNFNQTFKPVFTSEFDPYDYHLMIFDRWGEVVFESYNAEIGWNGKYGASGELVEDGVYV
jgi:gliding motility-associated-like protein